MIEFAVEAPTIPIPFHKLLRPRLALAAFTVLLLAAAQGRVHAAPTSGGALARIRDTGRLTLGYRGDARPFSYTDGR